MNVCRHCDRRIIVDDGVWVDLEATGDDAIWAETCDARETFPAEHEPKMARAFGIAAPAPIIIEIPTAEALAARHAVR